VDTSSLNTSVKVLVADDSLINKAVSRRFLRVTFIRDGDPCERVFAGKSVLSAYRRPPEESHSRSAHSRQYKRWLLI
jgi:hypothetical protein